MKTLKQFQYFIAIVEHGSFTAASEHLFIAQSALSRQIKILGGVSKSMLALNESIIDIKEH